MGREEYSLVNMIDPSSERGKLLFSFFALDGSNWPEKLEVVQDLPKFGLQKVFQAAWLKFTGGKYIIKQNPDGKLTNHDLFLVAVDSWIGIFGNRTTPEGMLDFGEGWPVPRYVVATYCDMVWAALEPAPIKSDVKKFLKDALSNLPQTEQFGSFCSGLNKRHSVLLGSWAKVFHDPEYLTVDGQVRTVNLIWEVSEIDDLWEVWSPARLLEYWTPFLKLNISADQVETIKGDFTECKQHYSEFTCKPSKYRQILADDLSSLTNQWSSENGELVNMLVLVLSGPSGSNLRK